MAGKTDLKNLSAEDLREFMGRHFEGITEDHTKDDLKDLIDENWDFLAPLIVDIEPENLMDEIETDDGELDLTSEPEGEEEPDEEEPDLTKPNPKTDLYSGRIRT